MSEPSSNSPFPPQTANAELAAQIVTALRAADFIGISDEKAVAALLNSQTVKAGDWRSLLEKHLIPSTAIATDHAAPNQGA